MFDAAVPPNTLGTCTPLAAVFDAAVPPNALGTRTAHAAALGAELFGLPALGLRPSKYNAKHDGDVADRALHMVAAGG